MSRNDLMVTAVGWAATKPKEFVGGVPFTTFRLASTPRFYDSRQGVWVDGRTEWFTVKVFRDVALNVGFSIDKGDPVLVHGRLCTEEWQTDGGLRTGLVLEAVAIGHDLTRGRSEFVRVVRGGRPEGADADADADARDEADGAAGAGAGRERIGVAAEVDPWVVDADESGGVEGGSGAAKVLSAVTP